MIRQNNNSWLKSCNIQKYLTDYDYLLPLFLLYVMNVAVEIERFGCQFIINLLHIYNKIKMIQFNHQDIQVFLNKEEIKEPQLQCGGRNKVTKFCISSTCQSQALCCEEQACETCPKSHMRCAFQMLADLTKRVKKRIELQKDIIQRFYIAEMEIINDIYQHRRDYLSSENFWETTGQLPDIIKKIYLKPGINIKNIKGAEIGKSFMELPSCTEYIRNSADYLIGWYSKQGKQLIHKFIQTKFHNIDNSFENIRETIDSKILEQDNMGRKKLEFILKQLNNPRKISLLFRASQYNFLAEKFHKLCDGQSHTLTIIRITFSPFSKP